MIAVSHPTWPDGTPILVGEWAHAPSHAEPLLIVSVAVTPEADYGWYVWGYEGGSPDAAVQVEDFESIRRTVPR